MHEAIPQSRNPVAIGLGVLNAVQLTVNADARSINELLARGRACNFLGKLVGPGIKSQSRKCWRLVVGLG